MPISSEAPRRSIGGETEEPPPPQESHAVQFARSGRFKGGKARAVAGSHRTEGDLLMQFTFWCIVRGHGTEWEGLCLDLDIGAHGQSLDDVKMLLEEAIGTYIQDAFKEDEATRDRLLARRAPFLVRLSWALRLFFRSIFRNKKFGSDETAGFPVSCPA
jgi:hypothetical protein